MCLSVSSKDQPLETSVEGAVEVSANFDTIMKLYITYYGISILRSIYILYLIRIHKATGSETRAFKACRDALLLVACVLLHYQRLSHTGQVCSGDFLLPNQVPDKSMLI